MEYGWGNQMLQKHFFCVVCMSCIIKWGTIFTCWSQLEYFWKKENGNWFSFGWAAWRTVKTMKSISKNRSTIPSIIPIMWFQLEVQVEQMCSETCSAKKCQNIEKTKQSHCWNCQLLSLSFLGQDRSSVFLIDKVVKRRVISLSGIPFNVLLCLSKVDEEKMNWTKRSQIGLFWSNCCCSINWHLKLEYP